MDKRAFNIKKIFKTIGNILVIVAIVFLIRKYIALGVDIREYISGEFLLRLIPVVICFSALISIQFFPWAWITGALTDCSTPKVTFYKVFQRANIMKYIPGNIFQYVGRGEIISEDEKLNVVNIAATILIESFALLSASLLLGFLGIRDYMFTFFLEHRSLLLSALVCGIVLILLAITFRTRIIGWITQKGIILSKKLCLNIVLSIVFFFVSMLIQTGFQVMMIYSLSDRYDVDMFMVVGGAYAFSWIAGYITPGASGGIGVREALFCLLLENYIATDVILVSVILLRGVNIIADIIAYAVSVLNGCLIGSGAQ